MDRSIGIKLEKWAIWIALIAIIFLLRHLFPIFFLTFVLSYIANTGVQALERRIRNRKVSVAVVYSIFLAVLAAMVLIVVPRMLNETRRMARTFIVTEAARETGELPPQEPGVIRREARELVDETIISIVGQETFDEFRTSDAYAMVVARVDKWLAGVTVDVVQAVSVFANHALIFAFHFVLAIILSFLIIWDLPRTKEKVARFSTGRTEEIYSEIAPGLRSFGVMLGRAFEAQSVVAVVNASLSSIVFMALGLPSIALLVMIVFTCSYIPILGMILSTIPAAFLAFKVGGVPHVFWLIMAILVIHAIEAYMLNPLIYGRHLRLHPVVVLVVLVIAEHLIGPWGLLLGVPVTAFIYRYVIQGESVDPVPKTAAA
jgi:predicted PurR-regulated permease PerM